MLCEIDSLIFDLRRDAGPRAPRAPRHKDPAEAVDLAKLYAMDAEQRNLFMLRGGPSEKQQQHSRTTPATAATPDTEKQELMAKRKSYQNMRVGSRALKLMQHLDSEELVQRVADFVQNLLKERHTRPPPPPKRSESLTSRSSASLSVSFAETLSMRDVELSFITLSNTSSSLSSTKQPRESPKAKEEQSPPPAASALSLSPEKEPNPNGFRRSAIVMKPAEDKQAPAPPPPPPPKTETTFKRKHQRRHSSTSQKRREQLLDQISRDFFGRNLANSKHRRNMLRIQQRPERANSLDSGSRSGSPALFLDYSPCHSDYEELPGVEQQELATLQSKHMAHAQQETAPPAYFYPSQLSPLSKPPYSAHTSETYEEDSTTVTSGHEWHPYFQSHARLSRVMRAFPPPPSWQRNARPEYLDDEGWLLRPSPQQQNTFYDDNWYLEPLAPGHEWGEELSPGGRRYSGGGEHRSTSQPPKQQQGIPIPLLKPEATPFYPTNTKPPEPLVEQVEASPQQQQASTAQAPAPPLLKLPENLFQQNNYLAKHFSRRDKRKSRNLLSSSLSEIVVEEAEDEEPKDGALEEETKFFTRRSSTGFGFINVPPKRDHPARGKRGAKRKNKQQAKPAQKGPVKKKSSAAVPAAGWY